MHRQDRNQEEPFVSPPPSVPSQPSHARQSQHDVRRNEMETAMRKSSTGDEIDDIAVRSALEMGYAKTTIESAVGHLRKQGMTVWAASWKNQQNYCAPSEDSDQPGHPPSLIRVIACAQLIAKDPSFLHADSEDSDQTWRMPRLIWVFAGRLCHFVGFVIRGLICPPMQGCSSRKSVTKFIL